MRRTQYTMSPYILIAMMSWVVWATTADTHAMEPASNQTTRSITLFVGDDERSVTVQHKDVTSWFGISLGVVYDPSARLALTRSDLIPTGLCPAPHPLCGVLTSIRQHGHGRVIAHVTPRTDDIRRFVTRMAEDLDRPSVDARFRMADGVITIFAPSRDGIAVDVDASVRVIEEYGSNIVRGIGPSVIKLPSRIIEPKITTASINDLGIKQLIGVGRSDFAGSTATRIHNIRTAAARFDGVILAPGEELSFTQLLGPVDSTTGYEKELVIINNQTRPEYGGGICQVSTTLFRAAVFTGLTVTQRRNHSYPVKYYQPIGFDATVYLPNPDLRFVNNTAHHILLHNYIEGTEFVFEVYGTSDGRRVVVEDPVVTEKNPDGSMKTYFTQKVIAVDGTTMTDDVFYSNYKSPADYPNPQDVSRQRLTERPDNWSKKQWEEYKKTNGM